MKLEWMESSCSFPRSGFFIFLILVKEKITLVNLGFDKIVCVKTILQKAICKCPPNALLVPINLLKCLSILFGDLEIHPWSHIYLWWSHV